MPTPRLRGSPRDSLIAAIDTAVPSSIYEVSALKLKVIQSCFNSLLPRSCAAAHDTAEPRGAGDDDEDGGVLLLGTAKLHDSSHDCDSDTTSPQAIVALSISGGEAWVLASFEPPSFRGDIEASLAVTTHKSNACERLIETLVPILRLLQAALPAPFTALKITEDAVQLVGLTTERDAADAFTLATIACTKFFGVQCQLPLSSAVCMDSILCLSELVEAENQHEQALPATAPQASDVEFLDSFLLPVSPRRRNSEHGTSEAKPPSCASNPAGIHLLEQHFKTTCREWAAVSDDYATKARAHSRRFDTQHRTALYFSYMLARAIQAFEPCDRDRYTALTKARQHFLRRAEYLKTDLGRALDIVMKITTLQQELERIVQDTAIVQED